MSITFFQVTNERFVVVFFVLSVDLIIFPSKTENVIVTITITIVILLHDKFLQFHWLRAVVFQLNLKYLHVKTSLQIMLLPMHILSLHMAPLFVSVIF